jgi:hypothetical protein
MTIGTITRAVGVVGVTAIVLGGLAVGCETKAEQQAQDGLADFQQCDLRAASQSFANAHSLDPSRADFALAYALSTVAVLPEDPNVTAVLERMGFTQPIDTSKFWGSGGVFDQLSTRDASCQSVSDAILAAIPYAPAQKDGPSAASVVSDTTLDGNDFVTAALAIEPRLQKVVSALEQGAGAMSEFDITGGCGVGTIHIESPEVYGLASFLEWTVATIQAAAAYDWGVQATLAFDSSGQETTYVTELNAHILHLLPGSGATLAASLQSAQHATALLQKGIVAALAIKTRPANSLFDWPAVPPGVLADMQTLALGLNQLLAASGPQALPFFMPGLAMDAQSFFTTPVDFTNANPPIWSAVPWSDSYGDSGYNITASSDVLDSQLESRFSPDPFSTTAPGYSFELGNRWQNITSSAWSAAFDPDHRWENAYGCAN